MVENSIKETVTAWAQRHDLRISDVYRDRFFYVDIVDDAGGKYEISVSEDEQPGLIKVRAQSNRKGSCGFLAVVPTDLDRILERAYSRVITWVGQTGGKILTQ